MQRTMSAAFFLFSGLLGVGLCAYVGLCLYMYIHQGEILFPGAMHTPAAGTQRIELPDTSEGGNSKGGTGDVVNAEESDHVKVMISTDATVGAIANASADAVAGGGTESRFAVLYFGGNAEDAASSYPTLKKAYPQHSIYIMHYRGYTPSTGQASERALFADAAALYAYVSGRHNGITLIGRSLGTGIAVWLASRFDVEKLVLVTPYDSMVNVAARHYPYLPVRWLLHNRFESWQYAPKVRAPTFVIEAERDETIPPASTKRLLPYFADGVAEHVVVAGAMHNTLLEHADYVRLLRGCNDGGDGSSVAQSK